MANNVCELIDDYLDGVLAPQDVDRFVVHLPDCAACRDAVQFEENLAVAIQATDRETTVPATLVVETQQAIRRSDRRRRLTWAAGIAASLVLGTLFVSRPRDRDAAPELHQVAEDVISPQQIEPMPPPQEIPSVVYATDPPAAAVRVIVRAGPEGRPRHIAVPQPTENDNVTFVMLLPTIGPREPPADGSL